MAREGSLEAPTRHPLDWLNPDFYNEEACFTEMERIFDICHGCRRCVSLCGSFPTLLIWSTKAVPVNSMALTKKTIGKWLTNAICATSVI